MENDKNILKGLADNPALFTALRNAIMSEFALNEVNVTMPNELIGQVVRANIMGRIIVEDCLKKILALKTVQPQAPATNPAR